MKNESTDEARFDAALAHGLARVALGLNIAIHGYSRLPNLAGFANGMVKQFAATFLPGPLVYITGFGIAISEAVIGTLLFFGLLCRPVLVFGTLLMLLINLRQRAHSAVGNSFGPNDICCVLLRIACNSSLRSFFSGRVTSAQIPSVKGLKPVAKRSNKHQRRERWPKDLAVEQEVIEPAEVRENPEAFRFSESGKTRMRAKSFERKQAKNLLRLETRRVPKFPFRLDLSRKFKLS